MLEISWKKSQRKIIAQRYSGEKILISCVSGVGDIWSKTNLQVSDQSSKSKKFSD